MLTAPNWSKQPCWLGVLAPRETLHFVSELWDCQVPVLLIFVIFTLRSFAHSPLRKQGAPVEQHDPVAGAFPPPCTTGCTYPISSTCQDAFPHRGWIRLELTQLSRKLFLSRTCGFQAAALAVTNPTPASHG